MEHSALATPVAAIVLVLRLIIGITLLLAGGGKLRHLSSFVAGVLQYQILPASLARWYGRLLPIVELVTGILLVAGVWLPLAATLAVAMFASFAVAVGINLNRKRNIPCFCFGADASEPLGWHTLARSILLLFAALMIVLAPFGLDMFKHSGASFSIVALVDLIPIGLLTICGLLMLALLEVAPLVIRAWTARAVQPPPQTFNIVWTQLDDTEKGGESHT